MELEARDVQAAFDTAHMLKGVTANCGMTPLYDRVVQIVEPLRGGTPDFALLLEQYRLLLQARDDVKEKLHP